MKKSTFQFVATLFAVFCFLDNSHAAEPKKKFVLVAGTPSHGAGEHEYNAGVLLLKKCLEQTPEFETVVFLNGWPKDANAFEGAATIMLFMNGGDGYPVIKGNHLQQLGEAMKRGAGLVCAHWAVEVPKAKGGEEFLQWIGGYFETFWSVNPTFEADFKTIPKHPVTRGVKPFKIRDEWYYHMRFAEGMRRVTPILTAIPPDGTRGRDGANSARGGNPEVQNHKGEPEHVAWAFERPDDGRGFGFTGAHIHKNWADENFRRLVLNALLWTAKMEVPPDGVKSIISPDDLQQNLDPKGRKPEAPKPSPAASAHAAE